MISIESFRVTSLQIDTEDIPPAEPLNGGVLQFTWGTANHQSEPNKYRLNFGIKTQSNPDDKSEDKLPAVRLAMMGFFSISDDMPKDKHEEILLVNGSSILYGIARGLLAGVSGAFGNSVLLPTVDMTAIVKNMIQERKRKPVSIKSNPRKKSNVKPVAKHVLKDSLKKKSAK